MKLLNVKDINGNWVEIPAIKGNPGPQGPAGVSPSVVVKESTGDNFILTITDANGSYDTPNLKGGVSGGSAVDGTTFVPSVSEEGVISWTNTDGKANPTSVNIKGPQGDVGPQGPVGPQGERGPAGVVVSTQTPVDEDVKVWINPNGTVTADIVTTDEMNAAIANFVTQSAVEQLINDSIGGLLNADY